MNRFVLQKYLKFSAFSVHSVRFATQTHYEVLGLKRDATQEEIKVAYKEMCKKLHPDLNKEDPKTHEKFIHLKDAYSVLNKEVTRKVYDRELAVRLQYARDMRRNVFSDQDSYGTGFRNSDSNFSTDEEEEINKRFRSRPYHNIYYEDKKSRTDAIWFSVILIMIGACFSIGVIRVSHSLKERNQKLARDSIEMDKVFREEIKRHDKQSTSELIEEIEELQRALSSKGS